MVAVCFKEQALVVGVAQPPGENGTLDSKCAANLINDVSLVALRHWLANPGSDVEKALKRAMRARHAELQHETRRDVAKNVLGVAVFKGRLAHLLETYVGPGSGNTAELLLALWTNRERPCQDEIYFRTDELDDVSGLPVEVIEGPLFAEESQPTLSERLAVEWSLPHWLSERWVNELGVTSAFELGKAMVKPGRITLRVNTLKGSRQELLERIASVGVKAVPTAESPWGLWLPDGRPPGGGVWQLPGWSDGFFEVQDEGSQLIVLATEVQPGEHVVDYCAGRGGKTWALASLVAPAGTVLAWDIDPEVRKQVSGFRAKRAGARRVSVAEEKPTNSDADVVLVDAPCSSTGALRRHPSQRWAISEADVASCAKIQKQVLSEAAALVKPGGRLVYATCSLLRQENAEVAAAFEATELGSEFTPWPFADRSGSHQRTLMPHVEGTDGFFMARWRRSLPNITASTFADGS